MAKLEVIPDIWEMMANKLVETMTAEEIRDYFGDDLEKDMSDEDVKKFFKEWLMNDGYDKIGDLYIRYVGKPNIQRTSIIQTYTLDDDELGLSAVVERRMTVIGDYEDEEQEVVSIEIDGDEYEVDSDVEDAINFLFDKSLS